MRPPFIFNTREKFGQVDQLRKQNVDVGGVAVIQHNGRHVYYLVTKKNSYQKPTYADLFTSLNAMKDNMVLMINFNRFRRVIGIDFSATLLFLHLSQVSNGVNKLAMPRIGCGLDGLNWDKVKELLSEIFANQPIEIIIYNYRG